MPSFCLKQRVVLSEIGKREYPNHFSNPHHDEGEIVDNLRYGDFRYRVRWKSSGFITSYRPEDLVPVQLDMALEDFL